MDSVYVSAVVFINNDLEVLTVRKHGTTGFMLPGGKPEAGEDPLQTAQREVAEELGIRVRDDQLMSLGQFKEDALNEPGLSVVADVYLAINIDIPWSKINPNAELAQLRWVHPSKGNLENQAPLNLNAVFPEVLRVVPDYSGIDALAVFTGSNPGKNPIFAEAARELGEKLAENNIALVYGGGRAGLMGEVSAATLSGGGEVFGIIPSFMKEVENANASATHLEIVETMHERKARMIQLADAFVALPGGPGTLEEFFEVWSWSYLGIHQKPVALLNVAGFWNPLLSMLESMSAQGFVNDRYFENLLVVETVDELLEHLA